MIFYPINILQHALLFALRIEKTSFPKPLSKKKELECFERIRKNDEKAKEILIKHNLRLVAHIVKKYYFCLDDQEDLISIGTIGLIKAVKSFNFEKKIKFATYASRCIENEILMYFRQIKKNVNNLYLVDDFKYLNGQNSNISINNKLVEDTDIIEIVDIRFKSEVLYELINKFLTPREKNVLVCRYGLYGKTPLTQQQTAKILKISRSYVSRIEKKAIEKLTKRFKK